MESKEYFESWQTSRKIFLRASTYEAEKIYFTKHIIPYFSQVAPELEQIKPIHVKNYVRTKLVSGRADGRGALSVVSVRKHLSLIKQSLNDAVIFEYIPSNPASVVKLPRQKNGVSDRTVFLSSDKAQSMLDVLPDTFIYIAVLLALLYGLRRSEVLGLKWSAIDFVENTISIRHTIVKNLTIQASDKTKTEQSRRTYVLLPELVPVLLKYKRENTNNSDYVFSRSDGSVIRPDYLTRAFQKALKKGGLPSMRFHDLRHSTASILFDRGWSLEDVKNWLGHSDIETTSNIYLHYGSTRKILLGKNLQGLFKLKENEK